MNVIYTSNLIFEQFKYPSMEFYLEKDITLWRYFIRNYKNNEGDVNFQNNSFYK